MLEVRVRVLSLTTSTFLAIQLSDHFVYIENQFFITSTVVDGVEIKNRIGDALVDRIIRAHQEGTPWRACIMIPLLPGYTFPIDTAEASSVRLILECQNRTISRGAQSIFSRLKKQGIDVSNIALRTRRYTVLSPSSISPTSISTSSPCEAGANSSRERSQPSKFTSTERQWWWTTGW